MPHEPHQALAHMDVKVKPHVREGHAVSGYHAERLKGTGEERPSDIGKHEKVSKENFWQAYEERTHGMFNEDGSLSDQHSDEALEKQMKELYSMGKESGVDPVIHEDGFVGSVYSAYRQHARTIDIASAHPREAMELLLNRENVQGIVDSVDALESRFQKDFGIKTERVDPFTFKFDHKGVIVGMDNPETRQSVSRLIGTRTDAMFEEHPDSFDSGSLQIFEYGRCEDGIKDAMKAGRLQKMLPSIILSNMSGLKAPALLTDSHRAITDHLRENGINPDGNYIDAHPDKIKEVMTKKLRASSDFVGKENVMKLFKDIDAASTVPALNLMVNRMLIPTFMKDKSVLGSVQKLSEGVNKMLIDSAKNGGKTIYVSRNPMNILTMSPEVTAPSCQSLRLKGALNITKENINVPASYNTQATNDFIMYTTDKYGQKNARTSLTFDPETKKYTSYEGNSTYGGDQIGRDVINNFRNSNLDKFGTKKKEYFGHEIEKQLPVLSNVSKLSKTLTGIAAKAKAAIDSRDMDEAARLHGMVSKGNSEWGSGQSKIWSALKAQMGELFLRNVIDSKTMLYGGGAHSLVGGSHWIEQETETRLGEIGKNFKDIESYLGDRLRIWGKIK